MKAATIVETAEGIALELREAPQPEPGAGQLLLRVRASALNRGELLPTGKPGARPAGVEAVGEVAALGKGVEGLVEGMRVMARCKGGFAEYALVDAGEALAVPERLSWEQAAAVPIVFLVAYDMLVPYGHVGRGDWVLVTAVSSGVGVASLQLAKTLGARVIGSSGAPEKLERLRALGLDAGIATRGDLAADAMRITEGHGADLSINNIGGSVLPELVRAAAYRGRIAIVGYVDGSLEAPLDLGAVHSKRLEIFGVSNRLRSAAERAETVAGFKRDCLSWLADGTIVPLVDRVFEFHAIGEARAAFDRNAHVGKIVLRM
ncbi:MAG: zinc-binding dehydrogenase [Burkholderiales bacterium]|nr:zinc-binding dehydrogenase [Burkholderiales bacterium]